ncbi:MAG: S-methyl-5-thioribose-1-phosphate isomerase [Oscillospiraceae bacterium]|nr:S-methyl-5-thioribose-1-phosphate isomerase [Oscillospiraceae bacterium]
MKQLAENVHLTPAEDALEIIDQTLLPGEKKLIRLKSRDELYEAIFSLRVRGAPAIGIFAGYALYVLAKSIPAPDFSHFYAALQKEAEYLEQSRPTAVNLSWALTRMLRTARLHHDEPRPQLLDALRQEAIRIQEEDIQMNLKISQNGLSLLKPGFGLMTHCNAGPLATSVHGTALGPILLGQQQGYGFHVYSDETRPLLQGARLTAYELYEAGVDVTLICDNMASLVMAQGKIDACLVGCDRIAANGDTANKIGTSGVAILAHHYGIPVYVLGPSSTIDLSCPSGRDIVIEERDGDEIRSKFYAQPQAPAGVKCYNPAFDVTPAELISGIVTEKGVFRYPFADAFQTAFGQ